MRPPTAYSFVAQAQHDREQARLAWRKDSNDPKAGCNFARTTADLAVLIQDETQQAKLAESGIETCRQILKKHPDCGPAHYYLGLNLGLLAETQKLGALKTIREMENAMYKAIELTPTVEHAGPHRILSLLYRDAPGWPISVGNRKKARSYIQKAIELAPGFPENRLVYLESLLEWGDMETFQQEFSAAKAVLQSARSQLTGENWASSWAAWDHLWKKIQSQVQSLTQKSKR